MIECIGSFILCVWGRDRAFHLASGWRQGGGRADHVDGKQEKFQEESGLTWRDQLRKGLGKRVAELRSCFCFVFLLNVSSLFRSSFGARGLLSSSWQR